LGARCQAAPLDVREGASVAGFHDAAQAALGPIDNGTLGVAL